MVPSAGTSSTGRAADKRGSHRCTGRVRHVLAFFSEGLVHTKGDFHGRPFVPATWQRDRVLAPLFGEVTFDRAVVATSVAIVCCTSRWRAERQDRTARRDVLYLLDGRR